MSCHNAKFFQNCCAKGRRAYAPYSQMYPYNLAFGPVDKRMDQWAAETDPRNYIGGRYVCWKDKGSFGCVNSAPNSFGLGYLEQRQWIDNTQPFGNPNGYPLG